MKEKHTDQKEKKKVYNYIITIILFIACCGLTLYVCELYKVNEEAQKKIPVIQGLISEIYSDDLEHYVMDNQTTVVYMCAANNEDCRTFEREFKKLLKKGLLKQICFKDSILNIIRNLTKLTNKFFKEPNSFFLVKYL